MGLLENTHSPHDVLNVGRVLEVDAVLLAVLLVHVGTGTAALEEEGVAVVPKEDPCFVTKEWKEKPFKISLFWTSLTS